MMAEEQSVVVGMCPDDVVLLTAVDDDLDDDVVAEKAEEPSLGSKAKLAVCPTAPKPTACPAVSVATPPVASSSSSVVAPKATTSSVKRSTKAAYLPRSKRTRYDGRMPRSRAARQRRKMNAAMKIAARHASAYQPSNGDSDFLLEMWNAEHPPCPDWLNIDWSKGAHVYELYDACAKTRDNINGSCMMF